MIGAKSFLVLWKKEREIKKAHSERGSGARILTNAASPSSFTGRAFLTLFLPTCLSGV